MAEIALFLLALAALTVGWINEANPKSGLPKLHVPDLWTLSGNVTRGQYLAWGLLLFSLKLNLDRALVVIGFKGHWTALHYLAPGYGAALGGEPQARSIFIWLSAIALPFLWAGAALTLKRLRSAGLPLWLVALFPVPAVNLLFFLVLATVPESQGVVRVDERPMGLARWLPEQPVGAAFAAIVLTAGAALLATVLSISAFQVYGYGLFVGLPFCQGLGAALLYGFHRERGLRECLTVALTSTAILGAALLIVAIEGAFCIAMAAPIALLMSAVGAYTGYRIQRGLWTANKGFAALAVLALG
ncbi:MAG: DUF805 domain-containing protein, partial [Elusimicrobia bacterium]|nr:DUF805 domain-containing protein [Elusimicrobiota bacterium]